MSILFDQIYNLLKYLPREIANLIVEYIESIAGKCVYPGRVSSMMQLSYGTLMTVGKTTIVWKIDQNCNLTKVEEYARSNAVMTKNHRLVAVATNNELTTYTVVAKRKNPTTDSKYTNVGDIALRAENTQHIASGSSFTCLTLVENSVIAIVDGYTLCCWTNGASYEIRMPRSCHTILTLADRKIAVFCNNNNGVIYKVSDNGVLKRKGTLSGHTDWISCATALKNGDILTGSQDSTIKVWRGLQCIQTIRLVNWPSSIAERESGEIIVGLYNATAIMLTAKKDGSYTICSKTKVPDSLLCKSYVIRNKTFLLGEMLTMIE